MAKVIASRWSSRLSVSAPRSDRSALDVEVVAVDLDPGAERAEPGRDAGDPVRFLVAQLAGAADDGRAGRGRGGQAEDRDLVDRGGHVGRTEVHGVQARRAHDQVGQRLADAVVGRRPVRALVDVGAHRPEDVDDGPAGRIDADVVDDELGVGVDGARDEPERSRRDIARDPLRDRVHRHTSCHRHRDRAVRRVGPLDRHAACPKHPFRVVARRDRLANRRPTRRPKPRQQDRRLHLRARHRRLVLDRPERGTTDHGQGRKGVVPAGVEHGAHRAQRFDDTSHRAATQRIVAIEGGRHRQPGEHAGHQPQARPGVPAVERRGRLPEPVGARRVDAVVDRPAALGDPLDRGAEGRHDPGRRADVGAVAGPGRSGSRRRPGRPGSAPDG